MAPYEIWEVPEENFPATNIGITHTPGAAITRMKDEQFFKDEKPLSKTEHPKEEGGGHTLTSEGKCGQIIARTSIYVKR